LVIIGISGDKERKRFDDMVTKKRINWMQIFDGNGYDGEVFSFFNVLGTPMNLVLDRHGKIVFKHFGSIRKKDLRKTIEDAL
jgi:hypothetical protein